jgi:hypothetical protein
VREWMEAHHPRLLGLIDWPRYRFSFEPCWAEGCGRPMILHSPWRFYICENTPMAIVLNEERYAELVGADQDQPEPAATVVV